VKLASSLLAKYFGLKWLVSKSSDGFEPLQLRLAIFPGGIALSNDERYIEIIYTLERNNVEFYQEHPDLLDAHVEAAINHLMRVYRAETQGKQAPKQRMKGISLDLAETLEAVCELYRGRAQVEPQKGPRSELELPVRTPEDITASLKKIKSSIKTWSKQSGRQGYLNYVTEFIESTTPRKSKLLPILRGVILVLGAGIFAIVRWRF
jgi:hypothetical protein